MSSYLNEFFFLNLLRDTEFQYGTFSPRYFQPPGTWVQCALESRDLLALCLKKIKAPLSKVGQIAKNQFL